MAFPLHHTAALLVAVLARSGGISSSLLSPLGVVVANKLFPHTSSATSITTDFDRIDASLTSVPAVGPPPVLSLAVNHCGSNAIESLGWSQARVNDWKTCWVHLDNPRILNLEYTSICAGFSGCKRIFIYNEEKPDRKWYVGKKEYTLGSHWSDLVENCAKIIGQEHFQNAETVGPNPTGDTKSITYAITKFFDQCGWKCSTRGYPQYVDSLAFHAYATHDFSGKPKNSKSDISYWTNEMKGMVHWTNTAAFALKQLTIHNVSNRKVLLTEFASYLPESFLNWTNNGPVAKSKNHADMLTYFKTYDFFNGPLMKAMFSLSPSYIDEAFIFAADPMNGAHSGRAWDGYGKYYQVFDPDTACAYIPANSIDNVPNPSKAFQNILGKVPGPGDSSSSSTTTTSAGTAPSPAPGPPAPPTSDCHKPKLLSNLSCACIQASIPKTSGGGTCGSHIQWLYDTSTQKCYKKFNCAVTEVRSGKSTSKSCSQCQVK